MSFKKPYRQHRASRKAAPSATKGFLNPRSYVNSKQAPHLKITVNGVDHVDAIVESMDMETTIDGSISLTAKQPAIKPDWEVS